MSRHALAALVLVAMPSQALAQDADELDAKMCRNGLFADEGPFRLASIKGEGRAYFQSDNGDCPEASGCRSDGSPYVLNGDMVIVSKLRAGHACAFYPGAGGGTAGYLPLTRLALRPVTTVPEVKDWLGDWSISGNPDLNIAMAGDGPYITGNAFWPARPEETDRPSVNIGEVEGRLTIFGDRARYDDGYCRVDFTLLGDYLIAGDNRGCGGMNVSFTGVYQRPGD